MNEISFGRNNMKFVGYACDIHQWYGYECYKCKKAYVGIIFDGIEPLFIENGEILLP